MEVSVINAVLAIISCFIAYFLYWVWCVPMNRTRSLHEVGYKHLTSNEKRKDKKSVVNRQRRLRKPGNTPPPYPNGWYVISECRDIKNGVVKEVHALGEHFAVFRSSDEHGTIFITDLYCPHLGASLGSGGTVNGDCVTCPFHNWSWDGKTGECVDIPYAKKAPTYGKLKTWRSTELNGLVYVWYHAEGIEPYWDPITIPQINPTISSTDQWVYQGRNEFEVSCHIEDIPENGADPGHLPAIHKTSIFSGGEPTKWTIFASMWGWHDYSVAWRPKTNQHSIKSEDLNVENEENGNHQMEGETSNDEHVAIVELDQKFKVLGDFTMLTTKVHGEQIGPSTVHLHMEIPELGWNGVFIQYVLPIEPLLQKVVHVFYTEPRWIAPLAKFVLWGESILVERDITIWNNKTYASKPMLATKEDRLLKQHRQWYSQFYSDNSKTYKEANNNNDLEW